jgi:hypothetical protein
MNNRAWRALLLALTILIVGAGPVSAQAPGDGPIDDGSVLVGLQNDVALPAGAEADAVIVVDGSALVEGVTRGLVAINSDVVVTGAGASAEGIFAVGGTLSVEDGATVKDVAYVDTVVTISPTATVSGDVRDIKTDMAGVAGWLAAVLLFVLFLIWIGWLLAVLFSALLLVAFGTVQARRAAANVGGDVLKTLVVGLLMLIVPWVVIVLIGITIVGIPLALGLAMLWAFAAFLGYLVVGLWIGERILSRSRMAARPYGAALLGVLILVLLGWIPFVTAIATWFGLGAVSLAAWRVLRGGARPPFPGYGAPYGQPGYLAPPPYAPPPYAPPPQGYGPPPQGGPPASWPQG